MVASLPAAHRLLMPFKLYISTAKLDLHRAGSNRLWGPALKALHQTSMYSAAVAVLLQHNGLLLLVWVAPTLTALLNVQGKGLSHQL